MRISLEWLQTYFEPGALPAGQQIADALTFHAFEIESVDPIGKTSSSNGAGNDIDWVLDVKITPNRGHDCLSHRGIAKELSAILNIPLKNDPIREAISLSPKTDKVSVSIEQPDLCRRYIACLIKGVRVGPSPDWLREKLEAIGQKSINNIVDATNYVMFDLGQPLHAFDAGQLKTKDGTYAIGVRLAKKGEKMLALDDKEYELSDTNLVIADDNSGKAIGIAGVKGGKPAGITEATTNIILESANFDGVSVRKTSQALKLRTDASERFQQVISPELAGVGMQQAVDLIGAIAAGEVAGFADEYPEPQKKWEVTVSVAKINSVLGTELKPENIADVFTRLGLPFTEGKDSFTVIPPFMRLDLQIAEDLIEEVARIIGYDSVPTAELSEFPRKPEVNENFYAAEKKREELTSKGYSEVLTSVFRDMGERSVLNKIDSDKPYLRNNLQPALAEAWLRNSYNRDLLGLKTVKIFEIGTVWKGGQEVVMVGTAEGEKIEGTKASEIAETNEQPLEPMSANAYDNLPVSQTEHYRPFSKYPFIVRDISLWVPSGTDAKEVLKIIRPHAGELLVRSEKFDEYRSDMTGKTSYAFRLVFQSFDRTLTDEDANERMESVYSAVKEEGWEVR